MRAAVVRRLRSPVCALGFGVVMGANLLRAGVMVTAVNMLGVGLMVLGAVLAARGRGRTADGTGGG